MAENKLDIVIDAKVQGAVAGVEAVVKELQKVPAATNTAATAVSKLGKTMLSLQAQIDDIKFAIVAESDLKKVATMNQELEVLQKELTRVSNIGKTGFDELGNKLDKVDTAVKKTASSSDALGKGFSFIKQAAFLIPGLGIAGIFNVIGEAVVSLVEELAKGSGHFDEIAKVMGDAAEESFKAKDKFDGFISALTDSNSSVAEQQIALKDANAALKEYGVEIGSIAEAQKNGVAIGLLYADAKAEEAKATALSALAAKEFAKQANLELALTQGGIVDVVKSAGALNTLKEAFKGGIFGGVTAPGNALADQIQKSVTAMGFFDEKAQQSKDKLKGILEVLRLLTHPITTASEKTKEFSDFVQKLKDQLGTLTAKETKSPFDDIIEGTKQLTQEFNDLKSKGKLTAQDIIDAPGIIAAIERVKTEMANKLLFDAETKAAAKQSAENWALVYKEGLKNSLKDIVPAIPEVSAKDAENSLKLALDGIRAQVHEFGLLTDLDLQQINKRLSAQIADIGANLIGGFAEGIGNVLAGVKNPFAPLLEVLSQGLISVGKTLIETSTLMVALRKYLDTAIKVNPALGIPLGIALVALGSALKSKISQQKFAEGGVVSGPTSALIGEAGQSEVVLPLSRLSTLLSSSQGVLQGEFVLRGQDMLLLVNRASASRGRTYG